MGRSLKVKQFFPIIPSHTHSRVEADKLEDIEFWKDTIKMRYTKEKCSKKLIITRDGKQCFKVACT
jgi:hypothetical protein